MALNDSDKGMAKRTLRQYCSSWKELRYDEKHNKPYFIGKREKDNETETLYPISCHKVLTFDELKSCIVDSETTAVNLAVYNSDSTVVLYKAELGLKPPILLKENKTCSVSDNCNVGLQLPGCSKKRKINAILDSPDQSETGSTPDCFQIDLRSSAGSDLNVSDHKDSEDSNTNSEEKSEIICS